MADHWATGRRGAADVARAVVSAVDSGKSKLKFLYPDDMPLYEKIEDHRSGNLSCRRCDRPRVVKHQMTTFEEMGYGKLPSAWPRRRPFSTDPDAKGAPADHTIKVREARLSAGADFWWQSAATS